MWPKRHVHATVYWCFDMEDLKFKANSNLSQVSEFSALLEGKAFRCPHVFHLDNFV